ncbi:MAG: carboxypeptidase-like regulatory domain-containing protein, partial [Cyanobacteria bacterium J06643_5]
APLVTDIIFLTLSFLSVTTASTLAPPTGFTQINIPFIPSYTVAGTVINKEGKPVGGARVEAVVTDKKGKVKKTMSVTNGAGIFFLENLQQGNYKLLVNNQSVNPGEINIDENSETMQEVKLRI